MRGFLLLGQIFLLASIIKSDDQESNNLETSFECGAEEGLSSAARSGLINKKIWPTKRIPYELDENFRDIDTTKWRQAIDDYHTETCLRFEPKTDEDTAFIHAQVDHGPPKSCGTADICYTGSSQTVEVSYKCSWVSVWVHEIGHALCLGHEHSRPDRDDFLDFSDCRNISNIQPIHDQIMSGHLYDYSSAMHYACGGGCDGKPRLEGLRKCSNNVGLSVLDADKINDIYDCGGCHRHRWFNVNNLTEEHLELLVNFAAKSRENQPVYLCRSHAKGDVNVGQYNLVDKVCVLYDEESRKTFEQKESIQVFGLTNGPNVISFDEDEQGDYRLYSNDNVTARDNNMFVEVGRGFNNYDVYYAGVVAAEDVDGEIRTYVGRVDYRSLEYMWAPANKNVVFEKFLIVGCTTIKND